MAHDEERVWELVEKIGICMLISRDGTDLRARPMAAYFDRDAHLLYFLTDAESHKEEEIARDPHVALAFADTSDQNYLSISGTAEVSNDRDRIRQLWSTPAKAWWDNPDDPSIRVLKITPKDAQYWEGPGTVVSYIKMAAAAVSSARPDMGENRKVNL
ncbi:pyridoxamine 5'-phosphate oxidase family protein [Chelativorans sp. M5D2P16]|uniref:pyridoxamine 5'-phosphate oxidase family protein n=1 Tax=Chelativorans sp. M5D2P16 TaxID=3095678 RepID=UPI002ACAED06|nr:pyridoxamine 5'-phosphate oxidase family protein [Chelativorans sp. M5D2P16]MDZ5697320.1 pyridoxamine 5'-phosphate oxidase family protein [Chelativorans sp. M5D2P16]